MTDHVKDQLCQRIEELESEKMELNEQLDIAQRERDEAARDLAMEQEHHQATRRSEEALAAHVERIISEWNSGDELFSDEWINRMGNIVDDAPATSLTRLKAQWQAEALEELAEVPKKWWPGELLIEANKRRRQAGGGEV